MDVDLCCRLDAIWTSMTQPRLLRMYLSKSHVPPPPPKYGAHMFVFLKSFCQAPSMRQLLSSLFHSCSVSFPKDRAASAIRLEGAKWRHTHLHRTQAEGPRWFSGPFLCTGAASFSFRNISRYPQAYTPSGWMLRREAHSPRAEHCRNADVCPQDWELPSHRVCLIPKQLSQHLSDSEKKGENTWTPRELLRLRPQTPQGGRCWEGTGFLLACPSSPLEQLLLGWGKGIRQKIITNKLLRKCFTPSQIMIKRP